MDKPKLLIIDDDESILLSMKWAFARDYEVFLAGGRQEALEIFRSQRPPLVTLDLGLPPQPQGVEEGLMTLNSLLEEDPYVKVIIISGQGDRQNALAAIEQGACDFFCKPIQVEEVGVIMRRALTLHQLESENRELLAAQVKGAFDEQVGTSPQMQRVFSTIEKVAATDAPILITGESGTGKELVSRAIHGRSLRKAGPFIPINCAAIPETLLESELFGHEKGAFTGAHVQRKGRIEMADKGTLFLDEIGDLPLALQAKLLRFLQEHQIERVGGRKQIVIDTRVIAATNTDLEQAIRQGDFREDLYYRLGVIKMQIPPLREREGDIELLAMSFLHKYSAEYKKKVFGFTQKGLDALKNYNWPGNVRELENRMRRAVIMVQGRRISHEDLELDTQSKPDRMTLKEAREKTDREIVLRVLKENNFNLAKSAAILGISRPNLYELMEKLGIRKEARSDNPFT
ncbi:MAG TPA: PEP-CTERM-box response regulator transcription factor [Syntrophobacteraceae bacterium]|nr:PEP-CTERM-box response regulator transcription factor [Syntrophobacteraceae bacterium]